MAQDVSRDARELIQRGLEHYARGRLREAVLAWQDATARAPKDPRARSLLAFARARVRERDTRPEPHAARDTLESPIPKFLASLTAVEADERARDGDPAPTADGEWAKVDTRRVLGGTNGPAAHEPGQKARDAADTWKELPVQSDDMATRLRASARGLVDECQAALKEGRADSAALAAEMALRLGEQSGSPGVDGIVGSTRSLFERAFRACIGDMKCAPIRAMPSEELAAHGFDHRAAFLMSRMDGMLTRGRLARHRGHAAFRCPAPDGGPAAGPGGGHGSTWLAIPDGRNQTGVRRFSHQPPAAENAEVRGRSQSRGRSSTSVVQGSLTAATKRA